jgi:hypothetical protein
MAALLHDSLKGGDRSDTGRRFFLSFDESLQNQTQNMVYPWQNGQPFDSGILRRFRHQASSGSPAKQIIRDNPSLRQLLYGTCCDHRMIHLRKHIVKFSVE